MVAVKHDQGILGQTGTIQIIEEFFHRLIKIVGGLEIIVNGTVGRIWNFKVGISLGQIERKMVGHRNEFRIKRLLQALQVFDTLGKKQFIFQAVADIRIGTRIEIA